jgi:hypothetical protein
MASPNTGFNSREVPKQGAMNKLERDETNDQEQDSREGRRIARAPRHNDHATDSR